MDRRQLRFNGRIAHESLRGKIEADLFTEGDVARVNFPSPIDLLDAPAGKRDRQLLPGAAFRILDNETVGGLKYAFGFAEQDGYVGWVDFDRLWIGEAQVTHRVRVARAIGIESTNVKEPGQPQVISLGSLVYVSPVGEAQAAEDKNGWISALVWRQHISMARFFRADQLVPIHAAESDPVEVAERLIGTPYLWGGNSAFGIDCSGLVQIALAACGHPCPGDSDQQEAALGETLPEGTPPKRGDLMFWKGHVGWVSDAETLLHANAHHMAVSYEPISDVIARIKAQGDGPPTRHARLNL